MESFRDLDRSFRRIPVDVVGQLSAIAEGRGREAAIALRRPHQLETLRQAAMISSVERSNAIEGITAPRARIEALVRQESRPLNRSEEEIAGYRQVLAAIHESAQDMSFQPSVVLQLHGYLLSYTGARHAGHYKTSENTVVETDPDGARRVRFEPVTALRTPAAMDELHRSFHEAVAADHVPYPLLCAAYVLDFLTIHPFLDGNGRMARLITLWLLYQGGYGVGRYVSLERIVDANKERYYAALQESTQNWHGNGHDLLPWSRYFLFFVARAYAEFDDQVRALPTGGRWREVVLATIAALPTDDFSAIGLHDALPSISRNHLSRILRELRREGLIELVSSGRRATWRRRGPGPRTP